MTRTRAEVVSAARYYERTGYYFGVGYCLKFSRSCAGAPGGVYDANAAWRNAEYKHLSGVAPAGTFIFWAGGNNGHVAVSVGDGRCISTDVLRQGRVDEVQTRQIADSWNFRLLGWTEDINGVRPLSGEWDEMATKVEIREVVDNALAAFADSDALKNAVRVAIEAERAEDAAAVWDHTLVDPTDQAAKKAGTILRYARARANNVITKLGGTP